MNCAEFLEQVGAWALGALEPDERAAMEQHLATAGAHQGCREAAERARATAARLPDALPPVRPGENVWRGIEAQLGAAGGAARPPRGRGVWVAAAVLGWVAAAAALVALWIVYGQRADEEERAGRLEVALAAAGGAGDERDACKRALETLRDASALERDAVALLERPTTMVMAMKPEVGKEAYRASVVASLEDKRAIVVATALPAAPGHDYQLWIMRGDKAVAAGMLHRMETGMAVGEIDRDLLAGGMPEWFAVSLETAGGVAAPTNVLLKIPMKV